MNRPEDIILRTTLKPGDLGYITHLHGTLYHREFGHGISFESIVAGGLHEFYSSYDPERERIWMAEHLGKTIGSIVLKSRGRAAQLRYFLIVPEYRGLGLGNRLMREFMDFARACHYERAYLWTTDALVKAGHLYRKFGFRLSEEKPSADFGKPLIEQRYDLNLDDLEHG